MPRKGLFGKVGSAIRRVFGGKKPAAPRVGQGVRGNRGIAMGSRARPDLSRYQQRLEREHEDIPANEVEAFVNDGMLMFVTSTNVAAAQFFPEENKMMVEYLSGGSYLYSNVSHQEALSFATAQSKGSWVWDHLRVRGSKTQHRKPYVKL